LSHGGWHRSPAIVNNTQEVLASLMRRNRDHARRDNMPELGFRLPTTVQGAPSAKVRADRHRPAARGCRLPGRGRRVESRRDGAGDSGSDLGAHRWSSNVSHRHHHGLGWAVGRAPSSKPPMTTRNQAAPRRGFAVGPLGGADESEFVGRRHRAHLASLFKHQGCELSEIVGMPTESLLRQAYERSRSASQDMISGGCERARCGRLSVVRRPRHPDTAARHQTVIGNT